MYFIITHCAFLAPMSVLGNWELLRHNDPNHLKLRSSNPVAATLGVQCQLPTKVAEATLVITGGRLVQMTTSQCHSTRRGVSGALSEGVGASWRLATT